MDIIFQEWVNIRIIYRWIENIRYTLFRLKDERLDTYAKLLRWNLFPIIVVLLLLRVVADTGWDVLETLTVANRENISMD